ncbi:hypothetical protein Tco_1018105 [Tanacetum coccineum]|uniref:Integrase, catalytic region, zinc finger, CCHC-type, peptidase aspartic, catalytic n=1 Tax=Tanacetum coccineum TaxID=301880 RepID=A0ABQ5FTK3_9ASTR
MSADKQELVNPGDPQNPHIYHILLLNELQRLSKSSSGLGHNLFSVGQFCDSNLEVAFRQHTCFIRNLEGVDLLTGSRGDNLYTLSLGNMMASSPICLLSKASKTKSWLWHRSLSHMNLVLSILLQVMDLFETLRKYYEKNVGIYHETSVACSPQQNGVRLPQPVLPESVPVSLRHGKTPYELLHDKPPDLSSGPALHEMTPVSISSGLVPNPPSSTPFVPPSRSDWDLLFQPMFDESLNPPPYVDLQAPEVIAPILEAVAPEHAVSTGSPSSTIVDQDAPSPSNSHTTQETQTPIISHDVEEDNHDIEVAHMGNDPYFGIPIPEVTSDQSSSSDVIHIIVPPDHQTVSADDNSYEQAIILATMMPFYHQSYPRLQRTLTQAVGLKLCQEELHEFERSGGFGKLVSPPAKQLVITLKWIYLRNINWRTSLLKLLGTKKRIEFLSTSGNADFTPDTLKHLASLKVDE